MRKVLFARVEREQHSTKTFPYPDVLHDQPEPLEISKRRLRIAVFPREWD